MKVAFEDYLKEKPNVKAILVGTRRTDPHGSDLTHFDETDRGWPSFMRVHPVIDWHYAEIWTVCSSSHIVWLKPFELIASRQFIRHLDIPYCPLYDKGYTSLGGTTDTHPNPALRNKTDGQGNESPTVYRPAYELIEDDEERLGRES